MWIWSRSPAPCVRGGTPGSCCLAHPPLEAAAEGASSEGREAEGPGAGPGCMGHRGPAWPEATPGPSPAPGAEVLQVRSARSGGGLCLAPGSEVPEPAEVLLWLPQAGWIVQRTGSLIGAGAPLGRSRTGNHRSKCAIRVTKSFWRPPSS